MPTLATYISFPGTAEKAFTFYRDVFGGSLNLMHYSDSPMSDLPFDPDPQAVAHAQLDLPGGVICGGDSIGDDDNYPLEGTAYSLLYSFEDIDTAQEAIAKILAAGGRENMPFAQAPWGAYYGQVFDPFGVMWAFNVG